MKKLLLLCILLLAIASVAIAARKGKVFSVQVKKTAVRSKPSYLEGKVLGHMTYTEPVQVFEEQNSWRKIKAPEKNLAGWMNSSALSKKKLEMTAGDSDVDSIATTEEVAATSKGFNEQVEKEFKSRNADINFSPVDKMEALTVDTTKIKVFMKTGNLGAPKGARQ